jgi:hypothetical protein
MADDPATEKASLTRRVAKQSKLVSGSLSPRAHGSPGQLIEHTPPTIIYLLPVLGGRNAFESNLVVSDLAAASKASLALIRCGEKAEATSGGSFMSLASFKRMYKYRRSAKSRTRMAIVELIRAAQVVLPEAVLVSSLPSSL